ncbi:UDP-N-acetylglucosamine--N-acetylmuramyl-(pentapeptide) pyrophosphoryl-undecaprenol N-acetylglucosamine transferase [Acidimicrobiaceae bacterium]|nr:UDP-N-acetylglucosamine--N-acetylmuramyl-(pentapeptide) pyrophosphoryl-undecaprenol N-acetylglucosamine transferase [Acidimicrobiaceae bacterium]
MNKRYCFFCVGTGGHVFPAKNIILQLLKSGVSEKDIIVITDKRGVKYFEDLNIERIQKDFFSSSSGIFGYVLNIGQFIGTAWELFNRLKSKNIDTIFTTGAYIAPYAALISLLLRSDFFIQEQNLYAGLGNKIASYFPSTVFESFPDTRNINKSNSIFTGPILNIDLTDKNQKKVNQGFTIGIQGGSQGSEQVNQFVYKFITDLNDSNVNFLHITGPNKSSNQDVDKSFYQQVEFIKDMDKYYKSIDFQISRAGGGILEAAYLNIPQLLVPFKHGTTANHQTLNAEYLVETGNAITVEDYEQFSKIMNNICEYQNSYLKDNYKPQSVKAGNDDIFKIITSGSYE